VPFIIKYLFKKMIAKLLMFITLILLASSARILQGVPSITYPIKFAYVNRVLDWGSPQGVARSLGIPGYSNHTYNYICLTFWLSSGPADTAGLWDKPSLYFGTDLFGSTDDQIRANIKNLYAQAGIKLMVSAFGAT